MDLNSLGGLNKTPTLDYLTALRQFYQLPVSVLKLAVINSKPNLLDLHAKIEKYATMYAQKHFCKNETPISVFGTAQEQNRLAIVEFQVETPLTAGLLAFRKMANDFADLALLGNKLMSSDYNLLTLSAQYGEHVVLKDVKVLDFEDSPFGFYNHRGKFVTTAALTCNVRGIRGLPALAKTIALNAAAYHDGYKILQSKFKYISPVYFQDFASFLLSKPLLFHKNEDFLPTRGRAFFLIKYYIDKYEKIAHKVYNRPDVQIGIQSAAYYGV